MRFVLALIGSLSFIAIGCGQHCESSDARTEFDLSCISAGSNGGYCNCAADYLFARYACDNFGSATESDISAACHECAAPNGETCNE